MQKILANVIHTNADTSLAPGHDLVQPFSHLNLRPAPDASEKLNKDVLLDTASFSSDQLAVKAILTPRARLRAQKNRVVFLPNVLPDPEDAPLHPVVKCLVNGLSQTAGLEDRLYEPPPDDREDLEEAVPERLTIPAVLESFKVRSIPSRGICSLLDVAAKVIDQHHLDDTFCIVDLATVEALYTHMRRSMPRVKPHYAVKCFPNPGIIATLASLGAGFDCASKGEVELVCGLGVPSSRIILAHPVKRPCDLRCISTSGIPYTTFDSEGELHKIASARIHDCGLVLRIRADDPSAQLQLGTKYGASFQDVPHLLCVARLLGLKVVGVSFHVGTGAQSASAFTAAIALCRKVFDLAAAHFNFHLSLLDIGGGFTGTFVCDRTKKDEHGGAVAEGPANAFATISAMLDRYFPHASYPNLRIISEPGRYFAAAPAVICTMVYGKRSRTTTTSQQISTPQAAAAGAMMTASSSSPASRDNKKKNHAGGGAVLDLHDNDDDDHAQGFDYWLTDGIYGNFNSIIYDWASPEGYVLSGANISNVAQSSKVSRFTTVYESTVFGPTCDSIDVVMKSVFLPELHNGDWLVFPDCGAYSICGACDFNGMFNGVSKCESFYVWSTDNTQPTATPKHRPPYAYRSEERSCTLLLAK